MSTEFCWLIEAPGARYLSVRRMGGGGMHDFVWSTEHQQAIKFASESQADLTMMAIRDMDRRIHGFDKGLFAFEVNLGNARPVEHGWVAAAEPLRDSLNDCVALLIGQVSGPAQREGIIREAIETLGDHYAGPSGDGLSSGQPSHD